MFHRGDVVPLKQCQRLFRLMPSSVVAIPVGQWCMRGIQWVWIHSRVRVLNCTFGSERTTYASLVGWDATHEGRTVNRKPSHAFCPYKLPGAAGCSGSSCFSKDRLFYCHGLYEQARGVEVPQTYTGTQHLDLWARSVIQGDFSSSDDVVLEDSLIP